MIGTTETERAGLQRLTGETWEARIAVLIPCLNEEATIAKVVADFCETLPGAAIYVYDNNSRDGTFMAARAAAARMRSEPIQGKATVCRPIFPTTTSPPYLPTARPP